MKKTAPILVSLVTLLIAGSLVAQSPAKPASNPAKSTPGKNDKEKPATPEKPKADSNQQKPKSGKDELIEVNGQLYTKDEKEKLDKGWKRLDYDWFPPEEAANVEKGLFKINGAWVSVEEADKYHSNEGTPWIIPSKHFAFTSNVTRAQILMLAKYAETTYDTMKEIFTVEPKGRMGVRIFNSVDGANDYAREFVKGERESHHSGVWLAYIGDGEKERPAIILFDGEPGKGFSHIYMGHAAAHKYLDATFPDPDEIPEWFAEGIATYCERYLEAGLRQWAIQSIIKRGGVDKISTFAKNFKITSEDPDKSQTKIQQAGLIIAYYILGTDKKDEVLFKKATATMAKGKDPRAAAIDKLLEDADNLEKKLKKYAGL